MNERQSDTEDDITGISSVIVEKHWKITKEITEEGKRTIDFQGFITSKGDEIISASDNIYKMGCRPRHTLDYWIRTFRMRGYEISKAVETETKSTQVPPHEGGPLWWESAKVDNEKVYGLLVALRSVLRTMLKDTPETLQRPSRKRTIERQIKKIDEILEE